MYSTLKHYQFPRDTQKINDSDDSSLESITVYDLYAQNHFNMVSFGTGSPRQKVGSPSPKHRLSTDQQDNIPGLYN
jgi:hypothetical protein